MTHSIFMMKYGVLVKLFVNHNDLVKLDFLKAQARRNIRAAKQILANRGLSFSNGKRVV